MTNKQMEKRGEGFEKILDSTRSFLTQIKEEADRSVKLLRLKGEISQIKRRIHSQYQALGEATYKRIVKKKLEEPTLEKLATKITRLSKELKKNQKKMAEISKEVSSPVAERKSSKSKSKIPKEVGIQKERG